MRLVKVGQRLREPAYILMHLNARMTVVGFERSGGTCDIPTDDIPAHLRQIGSRFVVVTSGLVTEPDDSLEQIREALRIHVQELTEHDT